MAFADSFAQRLALYDLKTYTLYQACFVVYNMNCSASSDTVQGPELLAAFVRSWKSTAEQTEHHPGPCSSHGCCGKRCTTEPACLLPVAYVHLFHRYMKQSC